MGERKNERTNERRSKKKLISRDRLLPALPTKRMATGRKRSAKKEKTNLPRKRSDVIIIDGATGVKRGKITEKKTKNKTKLGAFAYSIAT